MASVYGTCTCGTYKHLDGELPLKVLMACIHTVRTTAGTNVGTFKVTKVKLGYGKLIILTRS